MKENKCCGTCKWHKCEGDTGIWKCTNVDSDADECFTRYGDTCIDWEGKDD